MRKLIVEDGAAQDRHERVLADLLRSAEPFAPNPFSKRYIYNQIARKRRRPLSRAVRAFALATLLIGSSAMASLAARISRVDAPSSSVEASGRRGAPDPLPPSTAKVPSRGTSYAMLPPERAVRAPMREGSGQRPSRRRGRADAKPQPAQAARTAQTRPEAADDPSEIVEAVRALRREHDPARAQRLLDHYLALHPGSAFTEEALALAIEAAALRRDPEALSYARRYLSQFPSGRFHSLARRALERDR